MAQAQKALLELGDLPPELIMEIQGHLGHCDAVALALTCRGFYTISNRLMEDLRKDKAQKWELLSRLNPIPGMFLCQFDIKFHPTGSQKSIRHQERSKSLGCIRKKHLEYGHWLGSDNFELLLMDAYQLLDRHLYGPDFGISSSQIGLTSIWREMINEKGYMNPKSWTIVNPLKVHFHKMEFEHLAKHKELQVHIIKHLWYPAGRRMDVLADLEHRKHVDWIETDAAFGCLLGCHHCAVMPQRDKFWDAFYQHVRAKTPWLRKAKTVWVDCDACPARHAYTVRNHGELGLEIIIDLYMNMGSCKIDEMKDTCWFESYLYSRLHKEPIVFSGVPNAHDFSIPAGLSQIHHSSGVPVQQRFLWLYKQQSWITKLKEFHTRTLKIQHQ
ncbi:hypothetical protein BT63DRAFT_468469 [Microthyrium microscopicum]|uniref:F-box domain-containing protein n=1 Tax=Microthyrium microscopicum TaxID=703497 RepID=A0A6A6ULF3_9PEZI|nr:hypothetical protein BT63DRAFT_468469 [Microthyrium microscopicum]